MSNKKTLNFDFLDESSKAIEGAAKVELDGDNQGEISELKKDTTPFIRYFRECYSDFSNFSEKNLMVNTPKYFSIAMILYGMGVVAERLIVSAKDYSNWVEIWAIVLIGGFVVGYFAYHISGTIYHWRVKWSGGRDDIDTSRNIWLFSSLPIAIISLTSLVLNQMAYGSDYFNSGGTSIDGAMGLVSVVIIIYSIKISYKAVRHVQKVEKGKAIWWFIILPSIIYLLTLFAGLLS
jgi:hypothetical protein